MDSAAASALHDIQTCLTDDQLPTDWATLATCLQTALSQHVHVSASLNCIELAFAVLPLSCLLAWTQSFTPKLVERLADHKPVIREKSRKCLLAAGNNAASQYALDQGKDAFTILESIIVQQGFTSKNAKIREMCLQWLVQLRLNHAETPLRPFMPSLITLLEDQDASLRDQAKESVITLFSDPAVPDAARSDLKTQLIASRNGIRKSTTEYILSKISTTSKTVESSPDVSRGAGPSKAPQLITRASSSSSVALSNEVVEAVHVVSAKDLEKEFTAMQPAFLNKETEHNWQDRERNMHRLRGIVKGGAHQHFRETFLLGIRSLLDAFPKALTSLRTTLAISACSIISEMAQALQTSLDPFVEPFLSTLTKLNSTTKKILSSAVDIAVKDIIVNCSYSHKMAALIVTSLSEKTIQARQLAANQLKTMLEKLVDDQQSSYHLSDGELLASALKRAITDANPIVRQYSRAAFWIFNSIWPKDGASVLNQLDASTRAQLEKTKLPSINGGSPTTSAITAHERPVPKSRPSMKEMISAQRRAPSRTVSQMLLPEESSNHASLKTETDAESMPPPSFTPRKNGIAKTISPRSPSTSIPKPSSISSASSKQSSVLSNGKNTPRRTFEQSTPSRKPPSAQPRSVSKLSPKSRQEDLTPLMASLSLVPPVPTSEATLIDGSAVSAIRDQAQQAEQAAALLLELNEEDKDNTALPPNKGQAIGNVNSSDDLWWIQHANVLTPASPFEFLSAERMSLLHGVLIQLRQGTISTSDIRKLSRLSSDHPSYDGASSPFWKQDDLFNLLFSSLLSYLDSRVHNEIPESAVEGIEASLILLKDLIQNQLYQISGREMSIIATLLNLRILAVPRIATAPAALLEFLVDRIDPIYALSCLRSSSDGFLKGQKALESETRSAQGLATAMQGFGRLFRKLPEGVLEEEVPLAKPLLLKSLSSSEAQTREAAMKAIVAAHHSMQDESRLFELLSPELSRSQIALLTYFMAKNRADA